jgi:hypothetical protein
MMNFLNLYVWEAAAAFFDTSLCLFFMSDTWCLIIWQLVLINCNFWEKVFPIAG